MSSSSSTEIRRYPSLRTPQIDADYLNNDFSEYNFDSFSSIFRYYHSHTLQMYKNEFKLLLNLFTSVNTLLMKNVTIGQEILNIEYLNDYDKSQINNKQKCFYILSLFYEYIYQKFIIDRRRLNSFQFLYKLISLINFLIFLHSGNYLHLIERLLKLKTYHSTLTPPSLRVLDYSYMKTELIWHTLNETLTTIIPFVTSTKFKIFFRNSYFQVIFCHTKKMSTTIDSNSKQPKSAMHQQSNCVGNCVGLPMEAIINLGPASNCGGLPTIRLFLAKYHFYPNSLTVTASDTSSNIHTTTAVNYIRDELKHDISNDLITRSFHRRSKMLYVNERLCDLEQTQGVMIEITDSFFNTDVENPNKYTPDYSDDHFLISSQIVLYYLPHHDEFVQKVAKELSQMTVFSSKSCILQMVCRNQHGYYLNGINIKKPLITDLALHYGKKFIPIHEKIIKNLNKKEGKGIVLLHGIPGSGKTHYIRYVIHEVEDKMLIYVPPDMAKEISSPEFLPFLMSYQDSILIIEDAENIIKDRQEMLIPNQAVANLLNLSDGLLGDAMHQQIIATFNCDLKTIDPALLRKGRLIANYEFNKLDVESAKILSDKLGFNSEINEPMTLAEIYNQSGKDGEDEQENVNQSAVVVNGHDASGVVEIKNA
ncbi:unnamed protein product [Didymodactylos carnosus]|nr:unnamed protein product [Didymodactylos carnosus]CAF4051825.1 unnamed protein product [Didymodactylos carnosus]